MDKPKLIIFDFDQTLVENPEFYKKIYSGTLEKLILEKRGKYGIEVLHNCRKNFDGKGELALFALNVPFKSWADRLMKVKLEMIIPDQELIDNINKLKAKKVIYSGSPVKLIHRILKKIGFSESDFNLIVGWQEPENFPVKWTGSPLVFEKIIKDMGCDKGDVLAVGDNWKNDLAPAKVLGIKTALIGKNKSGDPDFHFDSVYEFVKYFLK